MGATPITETRRLAGQFVQGRAENRRLRPATVALGAAVIPLLAFALGARGVSLIIALAVALAGLLLLVRNLQPAAAPRQAAAPAEQLAAPVAATPAAAALVAATPEAGAAPQPGGQGEQKVNAILDGLGPHWSALHDVSLGGGRLDHVLVGPGGAFTIKSEPRRGLVRASRLDPALIARVYTEKGSLERISGLFVQPLLVIGDAHLGRTPIARVDGVVVMPARELAGYLTRLCPVFEDGHAAELGEAFRLALETDAAPQPVPA
jgi:hypothetical protein